jgi:transposase
MMSCKRCGHIKSVKNGKVRGLARFRCKNCGYNFIEGDRRLKDSVVVKKALAVLLYSLGRASFGMLGKILGCSRSLVYRWIVEEGAKISDPVISGDIKEIEFDEMWHFVQSKKTKNGSSKPWIVATGELLPGLSAIVMLQHSSGSMTKSSI